VQQEERKGQQQQGGPESEQEAHARHGNRSDLSRFRQRDPARIGG
jgi:hypothetical protein